MVSPHFTDQEIEVNFTAKVHINKLISGGFKI